MKKTPSLKLIPREAQAELDRQDAERAEARRTASDRQFRDNFVRVHAYEIMLASKWGAEADVAGNPEVVVRSIRDKYPPRKPGRFIRWLFQFRNRVGAPIFQFNPAPLGFIFNEGGRGVTLTLTRMVPFRLYVAGWVLMCQGGEVSFRHH
jgi:hypothetical protein